MRVSLPINTVGRWADEVWRCASTLPAAYPIFMTSSGVMGISPTLPRTPSVPKYLRCMTPIRSEALRSGDSTSDGVPYSERIAGFADIVHTHDTRAGIDRKERGCHAAVDSIANGTAGDGANHA